GACLRRRRGPSARSRDQGADRAAGKALHFASVRVPLVLSLPSGMRDRYTITERLDHGGMAEVFRGVAESMAGFKKNVAIKRILPNLTKNDKFVKMFLDEARLS